MSKSIFKNVAFLLQSRILSTFISFLSHIFIARLLGSFQYGLVSQLVVLVSIIGIFRYWGINTALIKYLAEYRNKNQSILLQHFLLSSFLFEFILGLLLSSASFFVSSYYANNLIHQPELEPFLKIYSFYILFQCLYEYSLSVLLGYEEIKYYGYFTLSYTLLKSLLPPLFVYYGYGMYGIVMGNLIPLVIISIVSLAVVYKQFYSHKKYVYNDISKINAAFKQLLWYGLPLFFKNVTKTIKSQISALVLSIYVGPISLANYSVSQNYEIIYSNITAPLSNVLFPSFSKLNITEDKHKISLIYNYANFYLSLFVFPLTFGILLLSKHMVFLLYGPTFLSASGFIDLIILKYFLIGAGSLANNKLIQSQGDTKYLLTLELINIFKYILLTPLIIVYDLNAFLFIDFILSIPLAIYVFYWIYKNYGITNDWNNILKLFVSSLLTTLIAHNCIIILNLTSEYSLFIGFILYVLFYMIILPLIGAIKNEHLDYLEANLKELGLIFLLFNYPIGIIRYIIIIKKVVQNLITGVSNYL
jgi:O-antigen/teichoic acid export membrane protein